MRSTCNRLSALNLVQVASHCRVRGSHVGIWPRGFATSLFGLVLESASICRTFVVSSQDGSIQVTESEGALFSTLGSSAWRSRPSYPVGNA